MKKLIASFAVLATLSVATARADFLATDTDPNGTFPTRQVLPAGGGRVTGSLAAGDVDFYRYSFAPGTLVRAAITASVIPDTVLAHYNSAGAQVTVDDDSGVGFLSLLRSPMAADATGQINFAVSGFPDFAFTGTHSVSGSYLLDVHAVSSSGEAAVNNTFATRQILAAGVNTISGTLSANDVDFFTFTGLEPGTLFSAYITEGDSPSETFIPDTTLGFFNTAGGLVTFNDDSLGFLSGLNALTVSADGTVTVAVSGFPDFDFNGGHDEAGRYTLSLFALGSQGVVIPEPTSIMLLSIGGLGALGYYRRRRQAAA